MMAMTFLGLNEMGAVYGLFFVPYLILHLVFTFAVLGDARAQREAGSGLFLFGPFVWSMVALFFGLLGVVAYWGIHHSSLRSSVPPVRRSRETVSLDREAR